MPKNICKGLFGKGDFTVRQLNCLKLIGKAMAKVANVLELYKIHKYLKMKCMQQSAHRDRMNTSLLRHQSLSPFFSRSHWICSATEIKQRLNETYSIRDYLTVKIHSTTESLLYRVMCVSVPPNIPARPPPSCPNSQCSVCCSHSPAAAGDIGTGDSTPHPALQHQHISIL